MIRRSINTNAPSSRGNSCVSDGLILEKIEKDLCGWLEEDCQTVVCLRGRTSGYTNFRATTGWFDKLTKQVG
jgi:hypothetical protein